MLTCKEKYKAGCVMSYMVACTKFAEMSEPTLVNHLSCQVNKWRNTRLGSGPYFVMFMSLRPALIKTRCISIARHT